MSKKKAGASKARQGSRTAGKRLGVKIFGGQTISTGKIILRQRGSTVHAAENVGMGRDFTLFALKGGKVKFYERQNRKYVAVV